jgi:hypothetical protein
MVLTLIFALGLPIWLVVEEVARLRGRPATAQDTRHETEGARAPRPVGVAFSSGRARAGV